MSVQRQRSQRSLSPARSLSPVETAFTAELTEVSIDEVFQTLARAGKDAIATIEHGDQLSCVWCQSGQPIDAHSPPLGGLQAFYRVLSLDSGSVRVVFRPSPRPRRIHLPLEALMLGHAKLRDESVRGAAQRAPGSPLESVDAVDSGRRDMPDRPTPHAMSHPAVLRSEMRPRRRSRPPHSAKFRAAEPATDPAMAPVDAEPTDPPISDPAGGEVAGGEVAAAEVVAERPATSPYPLAVAELIDELPAAQSAQGAEAAGFWPAGSAMGLRPWQLGAALLASGLVGALLLWLLGPSLPPDVTGVGAVAAAPGIAPGIAPGMAPRTANAAAHARTAPGPASPESAGDDPTALAPPSEPVAAPSTARTYAVEVEVEPESAVLRLDGTPVAVGEIRMELPSDGRAHELRISADGYRSQTLRLQDAPLMSRLRLKRLRSTGRAKVARARPASPSSPVPSAAPVPSPSAVSVSPPATGSGAGRAGEAAGEAGPATASAEPSTPDPGTAPAPQPTEPLPQPRVQIIE